MRFRAAPVRGRQLAIGHGRAQAATRSVWARREDDLNGDGNVGDILGREISGVITLAVAAALSPLRLR
jgi:hypothetical protein